MEIRPLDLDDDQSMAAAYAVECSANLQVRPGWVPLGQAARIHGWRFADGWQHRLLGAWDGAALLGFAAGMTADDTPDSTWIFVWVDPEHQHAGVGSALARAAEKASPSTTTRFVASAYRATPAGIDAVVRRFAGPLGYTPATTETVVELDLRTTPLPAPKVPARYEISTHVNGIPEQFRKQVGQIKGLVDAEAPNGELGWGVTEVSPEEYASELELWAAQGQTVFESLAVDSTGDVAAWTCLLAATENLAATESNRPAQIEATLVLSPHRGHGLGMTVKLACLHAAAETGTVHRVRTSSDDTNVWMRAINTGLGFIPVESEIILQKVSVPAPAPSAG